MYAQFFSSQLSHIIYALWRSGTGYKKRDEELELDERLLYWNLDGKMEPTNHNNFCVSMCELDIIRRGILYLSLALIPGECICLSCIKCFYAWHFRGRLHLSASTIYICEFGIRRVDMRLHYSCILKYVLINSFCRVGRFSVCCLESFFPFRQACGRDLHAW